MDNTHIQYESGAKRSSVRPRYRDIPFVFLERIAKAFSHGAVEYESGLPPWEKNWEKGDVTFALDVIDHAVEHLYRYKEEVRSRLHGEELSQEEDHLGHLGANLAMLAQFEAWGFWDPTEGEAESYKDHEELAEELAEAAVEHADIPAPTLSEDSVSKKIMDFFKGIA